jgi:Fic family protein
MPGLEAFVWQPSIKTKAYTSTLLQQSGLIMGRMEPQRRRTNGELFHAYVPDRLSESRFSFNAETTHLISATGNAISNLAHNSSLLRPTGFFGRAALRTDAVGTSDLDALGVSVRRLARADFCRAYSVESNDVVAIEVLDVIDAMASAICEQDGPVTLQRIRNLHNSLLRKSSKPGGVLRVKQNVIRRPNGSRYFPPPANLVPNFVDDLVSYCSETRHDFITQSAIAHAQFLTIHPFFDGNGRIARAIVPMIWRYRTKLVPSVLPFRLVWGFEPGAYVRALNATRFNSYAIPSGMSGTEYWVQSFCRAYNRAVDRANLFQENARQLSETWLARIHPFSPEGSVCKLIEVLLFNPVLSVESASRILGIGEEVAQGGLTMLMRAGVVTALSGGTVMFEAGEMLEAFDEFERPVRERLLISRRAKSRDHEMS